MKHLCVLMIMFLLSVFCFAQQNAGIKVIGKIPDSTVNRLYQLQVGSFRTNCNAETAFEKLKASSLNPSYEKYRDLTRVLIKGVKPREVSSYIERIKRAGFSEVLIKIDPANGTTTQSPSTNLQPLAAVQPSVYDSPEDFNVPKSQPEIPPQNNGQENTFPETGLWKLTGRDTASTDWKADIVIERIRNNNFYGYFDWYRGPGFDYSGKEYFTGQFDKNTDKIIFQGTRLENSDNLSVGKYEADLSVNKDKFINGRWEGRNGVPSSDWQASKGK